MKWHWHDVPCESDERSFKTPVIWVYTAFKNNVTFYPCTINGLNPNLTSSTCNGIETRPWRGWRMFETILPEDMQLRTTWSHEQRPYNTIQYPYHTIVSCILTLFDCWTCFISMFSFHMQSLLWGWFAVGGCRLLFLSYYCQCFFFQRKQCRPWSKPSNLDLNCLQNERINVGVKLMQEFLIY